MSYQNAIVRLKEIGYEIFLQSDGMRYKFKGRGIPPETEVKALLDYIKSNKNEIIRYLKDMSITSKEAIPILERFKGRKQEVVEYLQQQSKPESQKPIIKRYEPTEADWELDRYHAQQVTPNTKGYKCIVCNNLGETYRLVNKADRWWFGWVCLRCKPERN